MNNSENVQPISNECIETLKAARDHLNVLAFGGFGHDGVIPRHYKLTWEKTIEVISRLQSAIDRVENEMLEQQPVAWRYVVNSAYEAHPRWCYSDRFPDAQPKNAEPLYTKSQAQKAAKEVTAHTSMPTPTPTHATKRKATDMTNMQEPEEVFIGYWRNANNPDLPVPEANSAKRPQMQKRAIQLLEEALSSHALTRYRGWSTCRLCDKENGSGELRILRDDVRYVIPQGYLHYLKEHNVGYDPNLFLALDEDG